MSISLHFQSGFGHETFTDGTIESMMQADPWTALADWGVCPVTTKNTKTSGQEAQTSLLEDNDHKEREASAPQVTHPYICMTDLKVNPLEELIRIYFLPRTTVEALHIVDYLI